MVKKYQPVGTCIYCGTSDTKLTDEHIIAYGLNANNILPEASCLKCNTITSRIELKVLRGFAREMRAALGFPTRRPKDVPKTLPLGLVKNGKEEIIDVPSKDCATVLPLPLFDPPQYLNNLMSTLPLGSTKDQSEGIALRGIATVWLSDREEVRQRYGADEIFIEHKVDHIAFAQMLGKIAYCVTVAELSLGAIEEAYVLPAILGTTNDIGQWVGTVSPGLLKPEAGIGHTMQVQTFKRPHPQKTNEIEGFIVAYIRLFSHLHSPVYMVIVGSPAHTNQVNQP